MDPKKICDHLYGEGDDKGCIPGCYPKGQQCQEVGHMWSCSYDPQHLKDCLAAQQADYGAKARNNEMVVDLRSVTRHLPHAIVGFWYTPTSGNKERVDAINARDAFLREYGLATETGPPLMTLDLTDTGGSNPFKLVTSTRKGRVQGR